MKGWIFLLNIVYFWNKKKGNVVSSSPQVLITKSVFWFRNHLYIKPGYRENDRIKFQFVNQPFIAAERVVQCVRVKLSPMRSRLPLLCVCFEMLNTNNSSLYYHTCQHFSINLCATVWFNTIRWSPASMCWLTNLYGADIFQTIFTAR